MLRVCPAVASGGESSSSCSTPSHSPAHEPGTSVGGASSFLQLDSRKKQVTLYDPTASGGCGGSADRASSGDEATTPSSPSSAPALTDWRRRTEDVRLRRRVFARRYTGTLFAKTVDFRAEVCSSALTELVQAVVNGTDACLFVYGPAGLESPRRLVSNLLKLKACAGIRLIGQIIRTHSLSELATPLAPLGKSTLHDFQ
ncbi:hypothetical protein MRX96_053195 [Rhipicephalus microplus]